MEKQEQGVLQQQPELEEPRGSWHGQGTGGEEDRESSPCPRCCSRQRGEGKPPGFLLSPPSRLLPLCPLAEPNQGSREASFPVIQGKGEGRDQSETLMISFYR